MPSGGEGEVVGVEPVKQGDGGVDVGSGGDDLTVGGVGAVEPATQPAEHMPHGVAVQHLPLVGVVAFGDHPCDPAFEAGQVFVARRQRCGGDQDTAQVMQELAVGQFIKGRVSQCPLTCRELTQDHRNGVLVQPAQHGVGSLVTGEVVVQVLQLRADRGRVAAQQQS